MIQLTDKILPDLLKLNRLELIVYIMIARYLTENEMIPIDHVQKLVKQEDALLASALVTLIERKLIDITLYRNNTDLIGEINEFCREQRELADSDLENDSGLRLICNSRMLEKEQEMGLRFTTGQSREHCLYNIIYNIRREYIIRNNIDYKKVIINKNKTLTIKTLKITQTFRHALRQLKGLSNSRLAGQLVTHFADILMDLIPDIERTQRWRSAQKSCARRLFRDYSYSLDLWKEAIIYFSQQDFWRDKLNSLLQVERNMNQFIANKAKHENVKVEMIK